jgi:hypothetical protein
LLAATYLPNLQLLVTHAHGLEVEGELHAVPQASSPFFDRVVPPVLMALLPRHFSNYPVFEDAIFRLDGFCPSSDQGKRAWLATNVVTKYHHDFKQCVIMSVFLCSSLASICARDVIMSIVAIPDVVAETKSCFELKSTCDAQMRLRIAVTQPISSGCPQ